MTAATNKVEAFNGFSDWVRFGQRGMVAHNDPVEQDKDLRFTSLLSNLVILHNTLDRTLPGIFATDYAERLEAARRRLTSGSLGEE
ncbi:Tn3 family transposase [Streptomyces olivochromogenes]|uniref:Tn3 family transposase n=1 Tax=Streptomyces olivochromogenes TaxID=1963 RepID=UPI001F3F632D|nr:Tn3 family transposase [Streptomyces olivochromogenes]MCF3132726.1 Tn3 family transposase [Streptomyces olivochromogenes]